MKRFLSIFGRLLVVLVFLAGSWLLYHRLKEYTVQQVWDAVTGIPFWSVVAATALTAANYVILVGYDWFAVRWVGEKDLPLRKIALASFVGYTFSYNFGATLFGTSVRYRLYSSWGVPLARIVDLLLILGLTFWFGVFLLAGIVFVATPFRVPAELEYLDLPFGHTFWLGVALLLFSAGYVAISVWRRSPLQIRGWRVPVPPLKLTLCQYAIACGDLLVAAAVLHVLLPPVPGGYLSVLGVFLLAFVVAVLTHVPGGYGVFDGLIIHFLPKEQGPAVLAALIVFRVIYYWIPVLIAAAMFAIHELTLKGAPEKLPAVDPLSSPPPEDLEKT